MSGQRGFTLIEAMAAGLISIIVSGAVLSVLHMTNAQLKESAANLALGQMQTVVLDQMRLDARRSYAAKSGAESPNADFGGPPLNDPRDDAAMPNLKEIFFCDKDGNAESRYRINTTYGYLEEWDAGLLPAPDYVPFKVAGQIVTLDAANSWFGILAKREGVTYQIVPKITTDKAYISPLLQETMYVRNGL